MRPFSVSLNSTISKPHKPTYVRNVPLKQWRTWFHNMDVTDKTTDKCGHFILNMAIIEFITCFWVTQIKIMHHVILKFTVRFPGIIWNLMWLNTNVYFRSFLVNQFRARDQFLQMHYIIRPLRTIGRSIYTNLNNF